MTLRAVEFAKEDLTCECVVGIRFGRETVNTRDGRGRLNEARAQECGGDCGDPTACEGIWNFWHAGALSNGGDLSTDRSNLSLNLQLKSFVVNPKGCVYFGISYD